MVLVEVVKLIVHIDWTFYFFFYFVQFDVTILVFLLKTFLAVRIVVVLGGTFEYLLAEHIKHNTNC